MTVSPIKQTPGAPPWLWFWTIMFAINLPASLQYRLQNVSHGIDSVQRLTSPFKLLLYPSALLEFITLTALAAGLFLTLLPWVRAAYLENRFRLEPPPSLPTLKQISEFVGVHAPDLLIKVNLL